MAYLITASCVDKKEGACLDQCPVECIYEGERMMYIHPDECIDCGACEPACPHDAIWLFDDVPDPLKMFAQINREFVDGIGDTDLVPGTTYPDHPIVQALESNAGTGRTD
jgi:NAD-dependent dihydropyrimidine dehydrogenase PreA subunit